MQHIHEVFLHIFSSELILIKYTHLFEDYVRHPVGLFSLFSQKHFHFVQYFFTELQ